MNEYREYRAYELMETKSDENAGTFSGYAATYLLDAYGDRIMPGAFGESIKAKRGMVPLFFNHASDAWMGFITSLAEDHKGLKVEGMLALGTQHGANTHALLKTADRIGYRVGLSIGFIAEETEEDENHHRLLKKIDLWEASVTPFPAGRGAAVTESRSIRNTERLVRDVTGCSTAQAKRLMSLLDLAERSAGAPNQSLSSRDVDGLRQLISGERLALAMRSHANGR